MKNLSIQKLPLDKKVLIEASAGTGKTYTIGLIVIRLLLEKLLPIEKIVLITFTKAATAELKKNTSAKILKAYDIWKNGCGEEKEKDLAAIIENAKKENAKVKEANLLEAVARIDEMPVFTIHGFCERLLNEFAFETDNFEEREIISEQNHIINRVAADFWRKEIQNLNETIKLKPTELSQSIKVILDHPLASIEGENYAQGSEEKKIKYALVYKLAKEARQKLAEEKRKLKVTAFNDMIENCYEAIKKDSEKFLQNAVKKKYSAILADEFQDTDGMQFEIFDYLFKDKPFFMIGDPKQAIYRFRGGDIFVYKEARKSAGENQFSMNTNYRSKRNLLNALNEFFGSKPFEGKMGEGIDYFEVECGNSEPEPIELLDNHYKSFVIWKGASGEKKEKFEPKAQKAVVAEIKRLLNKGVEPKSIAILLNKNEDCLAYKNALAQENIFAIVKGASVFASEAANFLRILLNAICYNNNVKYIRALLMNNFCGFEPESINNAFIEWANVIYETKIRWERHGIMNAIDFFMSRQNLWSRVKERINGERNITNIRQIMELLNEEEIKLGKIPEKVNRRFAEFCKETDNNETAEERLETDEDALKIMTIHKSKGLQFKIVFVPDISKKPHSHIFPHVYMYHNKTEQTIAYLEKDEYAKERNDKEEKEEIARLLYVALTRTIYRLYVAYSPCNNRSKSFLREIFDDFCNSNTCSDIQIVNQIPDEEYEYNKDNKIKEHKIEAESLPSKIETAWQKTSFTGISNNLEHKDYIPFLQIKAGLNPCLQEAEIPAGKRMGTLLHSIFENLDFNADENEIQNMVENKLGGFKEFSKEEAEGNNRRSWIENKIHVILNKTLQGGAGKLCKIDASKKVAELNFFMKAEKIDLKKIKEIMGNKIYNFETENLAAKYMNGAIDLVFLGADGKYYILDWKSNNLNDFSQAGMEEAMLHSGYHLQYYIYAVALKRWLEKIHRNFNFREKFGGAYYIFIRGVNEEPENGIYFASGKDIVDDIVELDSNLLY